MSSIFERCFSIVESLSKRDPIVRESGQGTSMLVCIYCHGNDYTSYKKVSHKDDCEWLNAKYVMESG